MTFFVFNIQFLLLLFCILSLPFSFSDILVVRHELEAFSGLSNLLKTDSSWKSEAAINVLQMFFCTRPTQLLSAFSCLK